MSLDIYVLLLVCIVGCSRFVSFVLWKVEKGSQPNLTNGRAKNELRKNVLNT